MIEAGWFGRSWGAPVCRTERQRPTPTGEPCLLCGEAIEEADFGMLTPHVGAEGPAIRPTHYFCHLRSIVGGVNHLRGTCFCCGGPDAPDPPGISRREAAIAAGELWEQQQREKHQGRPDP